MDEEAIAIAIDRARQTEAINMPETAERKPRVLHVLTLYRPTFTGDGLYWEKFWPHLTAMGGVHDFLVVETPRPREDGVAAPGQARLIYLSRTSPERRVRKILELELWLLFNLHRYDILHSHSHIDRFFMSHWLARLLKIPVVYSATLDDTPKVLSTTYRPLLRPYARYMLRRLNHMIALGSHLSEDAIRDLGEKRVSLIPNGVSCPPAKRSRAQMRRHFSIPEDAFVLLSVGGILRRKAPHVLIENHGRLIADGCPCHLVLVGPDMEPEYAAETRALAARLGIADCVHFAGYSDEPSSFYEMADIFVFASTGEGSPNVTAEAMYTGLPVVSRDFSGAADTSVRHGTTGFLFVDENDYRKYVRQLAENPELRSKMGAAAQQWVKQERSMPAVAMRYQNIYNRLAKRK